ncbi:MAG TPA: type VI secretion system-associated protein TagF [Polyangiaceae bacterium]|nr:type VI secretion system-associated protein TagF [Polyangiaceae bacterium]
MSAFEVGRSGAVGKLPARAEYLPVPSHAPSFAELDGWLTSASEWALRAGGPNWPEAFAHGAMHGFVFRGAGEAADSALCGALAPSRDSAGRQFPLALAAPVRVDPELLTRPELLPFTLEGLWATATNELAELLHERALEGSIAPPLGADDADVAEAAHLYDNWSRTLPLVEFWALLGPALVHPAATLRLIFEALGPARGIEPATTTLSLRLPLGLVGGAALCVWLDVVRRYLGWQKTLPSLFWSHDGTTGFALLHLGKPSKTALTELWLPSGARDDVVDVTSAVDPSTTDAFSPLPEAVTAALATPHATVAQLLTSLGA